MTIAEQYHAEVRKGERFEFGKNWQRFLQNLTVPRIKLAEESLKTYLQADRLDGKTFLDIGSGSGLFSLAARRLGAKVRSFDYDPQSVNCTRELRRRFFNNDSNWVVEQGSVLDKNYLSALGCFDVVYSWGVLHHTGSMWQALENVKPLVADGGHMFIAIYNDLGEITDEWARVKRIYNSLPRPFAFLYALAIIGRDEYKQVRYYYRNSTLKEWLRNRIEYGERTLRGMSWWHDQIDWVGGYPYERATVEQVVDVYAKDGFRLTKLFDAGNGYGCNEFVFRREAPLGTFIAPPSLGDRSMARKIGHIVQPPFERIGDVWTCAAPTDIYARPDMHLFLIRNDTVVSELAILPGRRVSLCSSDADLAELTASSHYMLACKVHPLVPPFISERGHLWIKHVPDPALVDMADCLGDDRRSNAYVFEDGRQLKEPHSSHDYIAKSGRGRFAHWGEGLYFSSSDGTNPNINGRKYELFVPIRLMPKERSFAQMYGHLVVGPFECNSNDWTTRTGIDFRDLGEKDLYLFRDDNLIGQAAVDENGRIRVAPASEPEGSLRNSQFRVVAAEIRVLTRPFAHEDGFMWSQPFPDLADVSDTVGNERSRSFVFEDGYQLPYPHAPHVDIANHGAGRFAHWEGRLLLSSSDGTDPNTNGRTYCLLTPHE